MTRRYTKRSNESIIAVLVDGRADVIKRNVSEGNNKWKMVSVAVQILSEKD